jgi:hypothetical protein
LQLGLSLGRDGEVTFHLGVQGAIQVIEGAKRILTFLEVSHTDWEECEPLVLFGAPFTLRV